MPRRSRTCGLGAPVQGLGDRNPDFYSTPRRMRWGTYISSLASGFCLTAVAAAQHPGHAAHPLMPGEQLRFFARATGETGPVSFEVALELTSPSVEAVMKQTVELPAGQGSIRLIRYLPRAVLKQDVRPVEDGGRPAIEMTVEGPTQSFRRWLIADDPQRDRLVSFIGTWRFMAVADRAQRDDLFRQFQTEFTRPPKLLVSRSTGEGRRECDLQLDKVQNLDELACKIRVLAFHADYAVDEKTLEPVNRSDRRGNPAALVEIEHEGLKDQRWVFAKFPEFEVPSTSRVPYRVVLDCPVQGSSAVPDFVVVAVGADAQEVWTRHQDTTTSRTLSQGEPIDIAGSQYRFVVHRFLPSGRLVEEYEPADRGESVRALRIEVAEAGKTPESFWLQQGKPRTVNVASGPLTVSFGPQVSSTHGVRP